MFPNTSHINHRGAAATFRGRIRPQLESYFGSGFEALSREALPVLHEREGLNAAYTVGEYFSKAVQIDAVAVSDDGWIDLGECKWGAVRSPPGLERELSEKVGEYPNARNTTISRGLFTRNKVSREPAGSGNTTWHCLEDLYA